MDKRKGVFASWFAGGPRITISKASLRKGATTSESVRGDFKPCPFCGGESVVMQSSDGYTSVGCLKCNPPIDVMMQGDCVAVKKRWNTRYKEDEAHDADE